MKANNILVNTIDKTNKPLNFQYKINGQIYVVPNIEFKLNCGILILQAYQKK